MNEITSSIKAAKNRPINRPITFSFLNHPVRAFTIENEPWFVGKDVCDALEITSARQAVGRLEDYEKLTYTLYTSGQNREVWLVNESGMYSLTLTSRTREAKQFKKWLTTEVLPQIRKTGSYASPGAQTPDLNAVNTFVRESVPRITRLVSDNDYLRRVNRLYREKEELREQLARKNTPLTDGEKTRILALSKQWSAAEIARFMGRSATAIRSVIKGAEA